MSDPLLVGKLPAALLRELLSTLERPPDLRIGPAVGEDACAIEIASGALVAATDPITLTGAGVGAHAVIVNANDVAVMGVRPRWFLATVLLPVGTRGDDVRGIFAATRGALRDVGAAWVGGHTEITEAVNQPVVVGQMLGWSESGHVIPTGGVRPGDVVVQAGSAPVEAAAVLAEARTDALPLSNEIVTAARRATIDPGISVVAAALRAAELGATAMHDPTEGGLATGLDELAAASGVALRVDASRVSWFEPGVAVCRALGADPWGALASGALLAAFPAASADTACAELSRVAGDARVIATAAEGAGVSFDDGSAFPVFGRDEVARILETREER